MIERAVKDEVEGNHSQTQLSLRFRLVTRSTFPAWRAIGMAQHTTRGVERPLVLLMLERGVAAERRREERDGKRERRQQKQGAGLVSGCVRRRGGDVLEQLIQLVQVGNGVLAMSQRRL